MNEPIHKKLDERSITNIHKLNQDLGEPDVDTKFLEGQDTKNKDGRHQHHLVPANVIQNLLK